MVLRPICLLLIAAASVGCGPGADALTGGPPQFHRHAVHMAMTRAMAYQLDVWGRHSPVDWRAAAFWMGVTAAYRSTGDAAFYKAARLHGVRSQWMVGRQHFDADHLAMGQAYAELYQLAKQPEMLADLRSKTEQYFGKSEFTAGDMPGYGLPSRPWRGRHVWWWCDALYMAPPVLARLADITGDRRYVTLLEDLYWDALDPLFDRETNLVFRDETYLPSRRRSPAGKPVFWGRGNGWVYAGLLRTMDALPPDVPRERYLDVFRRMTQAIVAHQQPDGSWRASLTEPGWIPQPESTATALFVYGLMGGVNRGYLDRGTHLPAALAGWAALWRQLRPDGAVTSAQPPANGPAPFNAASVTEYGQGAFLLAASELYAAGPKPAEAARRYAGGRRDP